MFTARSSAIAGLLGSRGIPLIAAIGMTCAVHGQAPYIPPSLPGEVESANLVYMPNQGQVADVDGNLLQDCRYVTSGSPVRVYVRDGNYLSHVLPVGLQDTIPTDTLLRIDLQLTGENVNEALDPYTGESVPWYCNYYLPHCQQGITNVHGTRRVVLQKVYPNVDMHLYGNTQGLKYLFVVTPGGDPNDILMHFTGHDSMNIDLAGNLRAYLRGRVVMFPSVVGYQDDNGVLQPVQVGINYQMVLDDQLIKFDVPSYNANFPLVLQIGLPAAAAGGLPYAPEWGTYYGDASGDNARAITAMSDRGMTATGDTWSAAFPNTVGQNYVLGLNDVFITRFNDQYARLWSTYLGGDAYETSSGIDEHLYQGCVVVGLTKGWFEEPVDNSCG